MLRSTHRFMLEYRDLDGRLLARQAVQPNFEALVECAWFAALRRGAGRPPAPPSDPVIEPLMDSKVGAPYCSGFRVVFGRDQGGAEPAAYSTSFFLEHAQAGSAALVKKGLLKSGDRFFYLVTAHATQAAAPPPAGRAFTVEEERVPLPTRPGDLGEFLSRSRPFGALHPADFPMFVPQSVLEEVAALAGRAAEREVGGVLLGHLRHDAARPELFVEICAQVPAPHAEESLTQLVFPPATWAAFREAIRQRGRGELMAGWWHSHPGARMCRQECPPERRRHCPLMEDYFSSQDVELHATVFSRAWNAALVVTLKDDGPSVAAYAWREGRIQPRAFQALNDVPPLAVQAAGQNPQVIQDEKSCCH